MIAGCSYFTYKYQEFQPGSKFLAMFTTLKENNVHAITVHLTGGLIQFILLILNKYNNNNPDTSFVWNVFFLLISRPLYILGFTMQVMPIIVQNKAFAPIQKILAHKYWVPYARLTYGVFLCNSIFMEFRSFNLEHGDWVQQFDLILLFGAFIALSFCFSFCTYLFVEAPMANLLNVFIVKGNCKDNQGSVFFHSQSAKAHLRDKSKKKKTAKRKKKNDEGMNF